MRLRGVLQASFMGAIVGAPVLGVGGRVLMRLIAYAGERSPGFSISGSLEVVAAGALYGAVGGMLLAVLPSRHQRAHLGFHAAALWVIVALSSSAARGAAASLSLQLRVLALAAFALLIFSYSFLLARAVQRWSAQPSASTQGEGPHV